MFSTLLWIAIIHMLLASAVFGTFTQCKNQNNKAVTWGLPASLSVVGFALAAFLFKNGTAMD